MPEIEVNMKKIVNLVKTHNSFALFCHINPDADALGSMNAFRLILQKLHKTAYIFCDGNVPKNLSFLKIPIETDSSLIAKVEVCIMLDCNTCERVGKYADAFKNAKITAIIDHHQMNDCKFDVQCVDKLSPSTADMLCEIGKLLGVQFDSQIAENLYAGISSDTGCFVHANTNKMSHIHAAEMIDYNFNLGQDNYDMFKFKDHRYLNFYKTTLRNTKPYFDGKLYLTIFNNNSYKRFSEICDDTSSFQFLDGIDGNELRVRITEKETGFFTLSFRSNNYVNVCKIAEKFGGGGHIHVSGATFRGDIKDLIPRILAECKKGLLNQK